ncbi:ABC transporter ATP-binding protein [Rhodococcus koreensis]
MNRHSNQTSNPVLEVDDLTVEFKIRGQWTPVVTDVSFSVQQGQTLALVGESGSGKTVTSMSLMRLLPPRQSRATGRIRFEGQDLVTRSARELNALRGDGISMIFQEPMTSLNPAFTVGEQIAEVIRRHRGLNRREAFRAAVDAMDSVGIPQPGRRALGYPHEFSGGMRQRVMIAIAVSCEPRLLIADEPTTALDVTIQAQILDLLKDLQQANGMGLIFVTHDLGVVAEVADSVAVMYAGNIVEQSPVHELFAKPRHPYTAGLLRSMPAGPRSGDVPIFSISGAPPRPVDFPSGCRFAPRCTYGTTECSEPVALLPITEDHTTRCTRVREIDLRPEGTQYV